MASYRRLAVVAVVLVALFAGSGAAARVVTAPRLVPGAVAPVKGCADVARMDLAAAPGGPAEIGSATAVAADDNPHGHWAACDVKGTIAPQTQFEVLLPTATYQGRYLQTGCGGYCGNVSISAPQSYGCAPLTDGAFVLATDNEGHYAPTAFEGLFGTDPALRAEFGYRSEHRLAQVAKEIIAGFYGRAPAHAYFDGCSQGGHEGLTLAQRYPRDFDGIVAGAPASIMTALNVWYQAWNTLANQTADGKPILAAADLAPLHKAVVAACDSDDGTTDGLIADPPACTWTPDKIACTPSSTGFCLNPAQVAAVRKLYDGPRTAQGDRLYPGWQTRGSELNWAPWLVPAQPGATPIDQNIATETLRYMIDPEAHPTRTPADVHFTRTEFQKIMKAVSGTYDATDPDLSAYAKSGGKLIMWHGWADPGISPIGTIAYDQAMRDRTPHADAFSRLYLLPGVSHCSGGDGPDTFNALGAVVDWVEKGTAPQALTTGKLTNGQVTETRPVYPYPQIAVRTGNGWAPKPAKPFDAHVRWLGSFG